MKRVLKWTVPVDGQEHSIGDGKVVHVGIQDHAPESIQVWTEQERDSYLAGVFATAYGTGHPIPDHLEHVGSVVAEPFVWHVYRGER